VIELSFERSLAWYDRTIDMHGVVVCSVWIYSFFFNLWIVMVIYSYTSIWHLLYLRIPDPVVHFAWHENDWHAFRFRNQNPGARIYMNQHRTW
jgi:hypothetical protein